MSKKIVIFIWEWNSEIAFFQEFVKKHYKVKEDNIKSWIVYQIQENFIIFTHPIIWIDKHRWWDNTFSSAKTYVDINRKIKDSKHNFQNISEYRFIYFCLTDKDKINSEDKLENIENLVKKFCNWFVWNIEKVFAIKEIETWFLAGLWKEFKENYPEINEIELNNFYKNIDIDNIDDTKELLKNIILKGTKIWTSQEYIWREFWKYIDTEQAKDKSKSFEEFLKKIDEIFWNQIQ